MDYGQSVSSGGNRNTTRWSMMAGWNTAMIYVNLPIGSDFGWGIVGRYISRELSRLEPTRLLTTSARWETIDDPLDRAELRRLSLSDEAYSALKTDGPVRRVDGPLIQNARSATLVPETPSLRGNPNIGYCVFEENLLKPQFIENGRRYFDRIVTASSWCTKVLSEYNVANVGTVIQGADPAIFHPSPNEDGGRDHFREEFVVFSGGKFEFRKGQDIVIRAFKVLQDRHPDVMLINAWYNKWPQSMETMQASTLIDLKSSSGKYAAVMNQILADNGIDLTRVVTLPLMSYHSMPRIYRNSDVGIFPNRCEGATNLVLMEYMACGRPVIATDTTGHADIVSRDNSLVITVKGEVGFCVNQDLVARWPEPVLDDVIDKLEWSYQNRDKLAEIGRRAGVAMSQRTWRRTCESFREIIRETTGHI